jgi:hypothetical protein
MEREEAELRALQQKEASLRAANERITTMAEEVRKAELVRDRLEGLARLMDSYPEGHEMRARLEALRVDRALEGVSEDIRRLTDALLYPRGTWEPRSATGGTLRRAHGPGLGGGEYSEARRSMQDEQTAHDAARLLEAFSTNHAEARMASPHGLDRPFTPSWADAEQAGLDRIRRDEAMRWLVDQNMLQLEGEAEEQPGTGQGMPDYDFGSVCRITDTGRELLEGAWERRPE